MLRQLPVNTCGVSFSLLSRPSSIGNTFTHLRLGENSRNEHHCRDRYRHNTPRYAYRLQPVKEVQKHGLDVRYRNVVCQFSPRATIVYDLQIAFLRERRFHFNCRGGGIIYSLKHWKISQCDATYPESRTSSRNKYIRL